MAHPLLEDIDEEAAVLFGADRALGHQVAGLRVEQALLAGLLAPALVGDRDRLLGGALDDRDELHPLGAQLVAEEAIDGAAVVLVGGVDRAQDVEVDLVLAQVPPAAHHQVEGALAAAVDAVGVVQLARAVDAQADQEVVLLEERAPVVVEQQAVGLEGVLHGLAGPAVLLDQFDGAPEEVELHQRRLAALPGDGDLRRAVRLQQLADVGLERGLGHAVLVVRVQRFLGQEEAVGAIDVAGRPARLRQQVEARRAVRGQRRGRHGGWLAGHAIRRYTELQQHGKEGEHADEDKHDGRRVQRRLLPVL